MESDILVDGERLRSMGIFCSFLREGDQISWGSDNCAYKFLVVGGRLVIGAINDHSELYAAWMLRNESVSADTRAKVKAIVNESWRQPNWAVTAAGKVGADGRVTGWKSECFRVETPVGMRDEIEQEVTRLYSSGTLTPH